MLGAGPFCTQCLQLAHGQDSTKIHSRALVCQLSYAHFLGVNVLLVEVTA